MYCTILYDLCSCYSKPTPMFFFEVFTPFGSVVGVGYLYDSTARSPSLCGRRLWGAGGPDSATERSSTTLGRQDRRPGLPDGAARSPLSRGRQSRQLGWPFGAARSTATWAAALAGQGGQAAPRHTPLLLAAVAPDGQDDHAAQRAPSRHGPGDAAAPSSSLWGRCPCWPGWPCVIARSRAT